MSILSRKAPEPTLEERALAAHATADAALSVFEAAALDLEISAADLEAVAAQADEEITRLTTTALDAEEGAIARREQARKIRALTGGAL